ncbi:hypothetical protein BJX96DRAFT_4731 [Aspergillus floccosus]
MSMNLPSGFTSSLVCRYCPSIDTCHPNANVQTEEPKGSIPSRDPNAWEMLPLPNRPANA